jgi:hypothetical protein
VPGPWPGQHRLTKVLCSVLRSLQNVLEVVEKVLFIAVAEVVVVVDVVLVLQVFPVVQYVLDPFLN